MKPLNEIMAAMGEGATTRQKTERLRAEMSDVDAPITRTLVLEQYIASLADFLTGVFLDLAEDVGALPSRKKADREMREALDLIRTIAVYKALEQTEAE